jgi:hypothetical protein
MIRRSRLISVVLAWPILCGTGACGGPQSKSVTLKLTLDDELQAAIADCRKATFAVFPDGKVCYRDAGETGAPSDYFLCLRDYPNYDDGSETCAVKGFGDAAPSPGFTWPGDVVVTVDGVGSPGRAAASADPKVMKPVKVPISNNSEGISRIHVTTKTHTPALDAAWFSALPKVEGDANLAQEVEYETQCAGHGGDIVKAVAEDEFRTRGTHGSGNSGYSILLSSFLLPNAGVKEQSAFLPIDATGGQKETKIDTHDNATVVVWAYNVASTGSQQLAVLQGTKLVQASSIGPLLLAGFSALGSPLTIAPQTGSSTTTSPPSAGASQAVEAGAPVTVTVNCASCDKAGGAGGADKGDGGLPDWRTARCARPFSSARRSRNP